MSNFLPKQKTIRREKTKEARELWIAVINRKEDEVKEIIRRVLQDIVRSEEPYKTLYSWAERLEIKVEDGMEMTT